MSGRKAKAQRREIRGRMQQSPLVRVSWKQGIAAAGLVSGALAPVTAFALPEGGTVVSGTAAITAPTASSMRVDQSTDRLIMDWRRFNIAANEAVRFQQPTAASIALNRVSAQEASFIYGSLSANGQIFLMNPSGVLFGPSARVDVAGLTASTLNITNQDFLSGNYRFTQDPTFTNGTIVNQGVIRVGSRGYAAFLGAGVHNEGVVLAERGSIVLASGRAVTLDIRGDDLIGFIVTDAGAGGITSPTGEALSAYVSNTGTLQADGGLVALSARSAADVIKAVVKQGGIIRANTLENRNGEIYLTGGNYGSVSVSGTVDASGTMPGQTGGTIHVLGEKVGLFGAKINVSGDAGGGTVLIGGDLQGHGTVQNAFQTFVSSDSAINADALTSGKGGKVIVWADRVTRYYGHISARGGANSGDGGFVEVSGKETLVFNGLVDTSAPHGRPGIFLLDPLNITITDGAGNANDNAAASDGVIAFSDNSDDTGDSTTGTSQISQTTLEGLAAGTNISLTARNGITIEDLTDNELTLGQMGTVTFTAQGSTGGGFSMDAGDKINITGGGALAITASAGSITTGALQTTGAGTISLSAAADVTINGNVTAAGSAVVQADIAQTGTGAVTVANGATVASISQLTITAGDLHLTGTGALSAPNIFIVNSRNLRSIGLGNTAGDLTISGAELQNITASANLNLGVNTTDLTRTIPTSSITVDGLTAANSQNIRQLNLLATAPGGTVTFANTPSTLAPTLATVVAANAGINVNVGVTATSGSVVLQADSDGNGTGAITTGAGGSISAGGLTLNGSSVGAVGLPLNLGNMSGVLSGTVSGAATTDVFNVRTSIPSTINLGVITATGHAVTIDSNSGSILNAGFETNIVGGRVGLFGTTIGRFFDPIFVLTSSPPILCNATPCSPNGPFFVNSLTAAQAEKITSTLSSIQASFQSAENLLLFGPSELITSGILPENIFKSLGSQVIEVTGGGVLGGGGTRGPAGVTIAP